jgi:predicted ribosomally synthesized peptide with SipW-like signal peptide
MFVRQKMQDFECPVNKEFQKRKLINSKTILQSSFKGVGSAGTSLVQIVSTTLAYFTENVKSLYSFDY